MVRNSRDHCLATVSAQLSSSDALSTFGLVLVAINSDHKGLRTAYLLEFLHLQTGQTLRLRLRLAQRVELRIPRPRRRIRHPRQMPGGGVAPRRLPARLPFLPKAKKAGRTSRQTSTFLAPQQTVLKNKNGLLQTTPLRIARKNTGNASATLQNTHLTVPHSRKLRFC